MLYKVTISFDMFVEVEGEEDIREVVGTDADDALEEMLLSEPDLDVER